MKRFAAMSYCLIAALPLTSCDKIRSLTDYNSGPELLDEWNEDVPSINVIVHLQPRTDDNGTSRPITKRHLSETVDACAERLSSIGITELLIKEHSDSSLLIRIPSSQVQGPESLRKMLATRTQLHMHQVGERTSELGPDGRTLAERVLAGDEIVPGQFAVLHDYVDYDGNTVEEAILLYRRAVISSSDINSVMPSINGQQDAVNVILTSSGGDKMAALTKNLRHGIDRIAILLDGEVTSAPVVQSRLGRHFEISGLDDPGQLAAQLMHPLDNPVTVEIVSTDELAK